MTVEVAERAFEYTIECGLLRFGPDACASDAGVIRDAPLPQHLALSGGYLRRRSSDYDALCLLPNDLVDFVLATQAKEWKKLEQHHGAAVREHFLHRVAA